MYQAYHKRGRFESSGVGRHTKPGQWLFLDRETVLNRLNQMEIGFDEVVRFDKEIKRLYEEQEKYGSLRSALYEDLKRGILTEEDFKNF